MYGTLRKKQAYKITLSAPILFQNKWQGKKAMFLKEKYAYIWFFEVVC